METIMNNYHLEGEIGRGSFSRVYKARDLANQSHVVIKYTNLKPKPGAPTSATDPQLLKEEIEVLRKIQQHNHSNVCSIRDVVCSRDGLFVVEEFCSKGDLLTYLGNNSAIPESQIRHLFWQVLKGVEHLHQIGIVHRDIKLENIMLDNSWHPKLTDFNLSAFWSKDRLLNRFCGSLSYSAPEIFLLVPYIGPELDVWSMGVLLYGLFYSKFPFVAEDGRLDTLRKKVVACQLNFPSTRANDQLVGPSSDAVAVMKAMMTVDPSQRVTIEKLKRHSWFKKEREMDLIRGKKVVTNGIPGAPAFGDNKWRLLGEVAPKAVPVQQGVAPVDAAQPAPKSSPAPQNEMKPKVRHLNIPQKRENASPRPLSPTVRHMKSPRIEFQTEIQLAPEPLDERQVVHEVLAKLEAFGDNKQAAKELLPEENANEQEGEERELEDKEKDKEHKERERQKEKECEKEKDKEKERYLRRSFHSAEKLKDFKKGKEAEDVPCSEKKPRQRRGSTGSGSRIERTKEWLKLVLHK